MDTSNWLTALGLYVMNPVLIVATFLFVCATFGFTWWLRGHIAKEQIDARDERLALAREEQAIVTRQVDKLQQETTEQKAIIERLRNVEVVRHEFEALSANSASVASTVKSLSSANLDLGVTLTVMDGGFGLTITKRSD